MFKPARHGEVGGVSLQRSQQQKPLRSHDRLNLCAEMSHKIVNLRVRDVRFPTSLEQHGSDAMVRNLCSSFSTRVHVRIHRHSHKNETFPPPSHVHAAAHRPGLLGRLCGPRHGQRPQRFRPHLHVGKRHRDR